MFGYQLTQPPRSIARFPFFGAAAAGRVLTVEQGADRSIKVIRSTDVLRISTCTSQEGLHATATVGDRLVSDLYLGFDYEVESPTCPNYGKRR